jgi:hypothetical protein
MRVALTYGRAKALAEHVIGRVKSAESTSVYILQDGERRVVDASDPRAEHLARYCGDFLIGVYRRGVTRLDVIEDLRAAGRLGPAL